MNLGFVGDDDNVLELVGWLHTLWIYQQSLNSHYKRMNIMIYIISLSFLKKNNSWLLTGAALRKTNKSSTSVPLRPSGSQVRKEQCSENRQGAQIGFYDSKVSMEVSTESASMFHAMKRPKMKSALGPSPSLSLTSILPSFRCILGGIRKKVKLLTGSYWIKLNLIQYIVLRTWDMPGTY